MPPSPYPIKSHLVDDYFPLEHDDFRGLCLIHQEEMFGSYTSVYFLHE